MQIELLKSTLYYSIAIIFCINPIYSYALNWQDLWQRADQQAMQAFSHGQVKLAAEKFKSANWQGIAEYRAGHYEKASNLFQQDLSATGYYNQGNALAHAGNFTAAINAYTQALKLQPTLDDAEFNRDLLKKILQQKQQAQAEPKPSATKQQQDQAKSKQSAPKQQQAQAEPKLSAPKQQQAQAEPKQSATKQQQAQAKPKPSAPKQQQAQAEPKQSTPEQQTQTIATKSKDPAWLERIPDNPGGLLQQKFLRDHLRYQSQQRNKS